MDLVAFEHGCIGRLLLPSCKDILAWIEDGVLPAVAALYGPRDQTLVLGGGRADDGVPEGLPEADGARGECPMVMDTGRRGNHRVLSPCLAHKQGVRTDA